LFEYLLLDPIRGIPNCPGG